ncbi:hypothetical protein Hanom_Chr13g01239431 [Helianthus anomalus]
MKNVKNNKNESIYVSFSHDFKDNTSRYTIFLAFSLTSIPFSAKRKKHRNLKD